MTAQTSQIALRARPYTDADIPAMVDMLNACEAVDRLDDTYSVEYLTTALSHPTLDKARDLRLWETEVGQLVGIGWLRLRKSEEHQKLDSSLDFSVHPDFRDLNLEDTIMDWAFRRAEEAGLERNLPVRMLSGSRPTNTARLSFLEQRGMQVVRYFFRMRRDLADPIPEPQLPEGFTMWHSSGQGQDVEKWVETFNLSFIDHWGHHPLTVESHINRLSNPFYNPDHDLLAIAPDGTFAAFCFCWIDKADNAILARSDGRIDMLGTRRGYRKIGLGRAMLLAGLHLLKREGMTVAKLGVDAENPTGALKLYESTGFTKLNTYVLYSLDI
jgi:mycothiol synthase